MKATYNLWLVGLSIAIMIAAANAAISQARRLWQVPGYKPRPWKVPGITVVLASGVWTMHFIGMAAFHLPATLSYDLALTACSLGAVLLGVGVAFHLVRKGRWAAATVSMAIGIAVMHYSGMSALRMVPPIVYDPALFLLSIVIALFASYATLWLVFRAPASFDLPGRLPVAAAAIGLAVSSMHYTAMSAAQFAAQARSMAGPSGIAQNELTAVSIGGCFLIISLSMLFSLAKPLLSLWRLVALILLGESAIMLLLDQLAPHIEGFAWFKDILDGVLLTVFLSPVLWRLRRDSLSLAYERARASTALASIGDGVVVTDLSGRVEYLNGVAERLTGFPLAEAQGKDLEQVFHTVGEDGQPPPNPVLACMGQDRVVDSEGRLMLARKDGVHFGVENSAAPIHDEQGALAGAVLVFRDVTAKRKAEDELNLAASVFSHAVEGIIITDRKGSILRVNQAFCAITGYAAEEVLHMNPRILSSGRHDKSFYQAMWERLETVGEWQGEMWNRRKNGEVYPEWLSIRAIHGERGETTHYVGIFSDISERIRDQEYIFRLAYYDSLTSVANRALLMDHLEMSIAQGQRHRMAVAVLFIDMDRFKLINDSLGHSVGDLLLQNVARVLVASVREGDTVSRFGGDEFVICLPDITGERADAIFDSLKVAQKIQRCLSQPFNLQGHEVAITPSIGVAIYPWDGETPNVLIKHADIAMYHAKSQGRDNVQMFFEEMLSVGSERLRIQSALRKALEHGEFTVYYQAQINLAIGKIVGAEALLRWHNPELGWVAPAQFIPVAEDTSLILPIGDWVLGQVCRDWRSWRERTGADCALPRIAINFSPRQFIQPDFVGRIMRELNASGVSPNCLEVEITEATLMHNTDAALSALNQLRDAGIRIAVDDFGVGYSSLSYLKKFPIDVLKIDQSFIRDISTDTNDAQIVRAVIAMGHSLNLTVLAEGVETEDQLSFLRGEGCQEAQGFLLSRPIPAAEFGDLLQRGGSLFARPAKARAA